MRSILGRKREKGNFIIEPKRGITEKGMKEGAQAAAAEPIAAAHHGSVRGKDTTGKKIDTTLTDILMKEGSMNMRDQEDMNMIEDMIMSTAGMRVDVLTMIEGQVLHTIVITGVIVEVYMRIGD